MRVATEPQLQRAVHNLQSNTTIVIAAGIYRLTDTLRVTGNFSGVSLRGETDNRDDVVLVGAGLMHANTGLVPYGIATSGNVQGIEIANLTIRDVYDRAILFADGTQQPHVYNVHLIDAGAPFIEAHADTGPHVDGGIVEYSVLEYTSTAREASTSGLNIDGGSNWVVRHNLFRNIVGPSWQLAGPAILARAGAHNTIVEGNTIVNCSVGVALGLVDAGGTDHRGGIIRNNMVFRSPAVSGGPGILVADSADTQVLNNTVVLSGTYGTPIEYQFEGSHDVAVVNNLIDGVVWARDGAAGVESHNVGDVSTGMFVDAASGDLHLTRQAVTAIDRGIAVQNVLDDWDGDPRPSGGGYDAGADELGTLKAMASKKSLTITGRITTSSGEALRNVIVNLAGGESQTVSTDVTGAYYLTNVASGHGYTVTASLSGYTFSPTQFSYNNLNSNQNSDNFVGTATASGGGTGGNTTPQPTVTLTSPGANATFTAPATITLGATASDPTRTVTQVSFSANSNTVGTATTSPYSYSWTNVAAGTYTLTATARFNSGNPATSAPITVTVNAPPVAQVQAPTVVVVSPTSGSSFSAPATVTVQASANAPAGVSQITFYSGSQLLGTGTGSTASVSWSNVGAGTYSVMAVVTDNAGATAQSAPVSIAVTSGTDVPASSTPLAWPSSSDVDPEVWPLVQPGNLTYVGAFRLPSSSNNGAFDFGGAPMAFNPANNSLFVGNYYGQVAEVNIPAPTNSATVTDLPFAGYVQGFADPTEGHVQLATNDPSNPAAISGLLVYGGNLYGTASVYYDANNTQTASHYRHSLNLSTPSFSGFSPVWQPTSADVDNGVPSLATGYASGYITGVPSAWQPLLGGPAISGQWGLPIIMRESYGPDAIVWDPSQLGSPVGKGLLYYTAQHATLGTWEHSSPMWGGTATNGGAVIVDRTRTALFFGRNGLGTFCYGEGTGDVSLVGTINPTDNALYCYDPTSSDKGQHAYPYVYQVWAYDLNDLAAVRNGSKQPWEVVPYQTWTLDLPTTDASWKGLGGVGYDPAQHLVYVSQLRADPDGYADRAVIHVFKIQ